MGMIQTKKVLEDLLKIVMDGKHKNIFSLLSDFKHISEDMHGVLPEIETIKASDLEELAAPAYDLVKALIDAMGQF